MREEPGAPLRGVAGHGNRFDPPNQSTVVTITVALADNPSLRDQRVVPVGGCSCMGQITLDGASVAPTQLRFYLSEDRTGVVAFDWRVAPALGTFGFGTDVANPLAIPFGSTGQFEALGSGSVEGKSYANPPVDTDLSPLTVDLSENSGSVLAGTVAGEVALILEDERVVQLSMQFTIEANPALSDEDVKVCRIEE